ncbi:uncharacterized protein LOC142573437 [Dermacentor variabilis]|uniref:uncharacterized protein LOC142573437 n=1 Tax=Dermacentor variabilis TaxID=34621 RepID=UPI003F5C0F9C
MLIKGVVSCLVVALLVAGASCHKLFALKHHLHPTVHAVPAFVHTTIAHRPFVLPAPLVAPRPVVQPLLVQPRPLPPPIHSTVVIQTAPRPPPPPPPPTQVLVQPLLQPRLVAPPQVLVPTRVAPPQTVFTHHHHHPFFVSGFVAAPPPRSLLVHAPPPAALPAVAAPPPPPPPQAVQPLFVVPEQRPAVTTVPLQPRLVHHAVVPTKLDELPHKVSYVLHQHTKLLQVSPPPPPPPVPAVLPTAAPAALVQPLAAVTQFHEPPRQVQVIREVIRPTYVIERLSKKQRKFRKIKMLKNCSLLKKLKSQLTSSAENLHLYDTHGPYDDEAHVDSYSHVHVPYHGGSANVEVYRSIHGHEFAKRNGR